MRPVPIGPVYCRIAAPPELVYQMLAAIGQGGTRSGERSEVLSRDGNDLIADFWTCVRFPAGIERLVRTRERVTLHPPDRLDYEHLDGPVRGLRERIGTASAAGGGTVMTYVGRYEPRNVGDYLGARVVAGPMIRRVMHQHFEDLRVRAEARAARSRVFRGDSPVDRSD